MDRRSFLRGISKPALALAAVPVVATAADKARDAAVAALQALNNQFAGMEDQCASLRKRMDKMEVSQKQTLRIVLAISAITLGVDVSLLI
jgi:hypothetical protein